MYFKQEWKISKPIFSAISPSPSPHLCVMWQRLTSFLAVSVSTTALRGTEQKDGGYDTNKLRGEEHVCAKLTPPPCPDTLLLSPSICLHLSFLLSSSVQWQESVSIGTRKSRATGHATSRCVTEHLNPRGTRDRERKTGKTEREREVHLHCTVCAVLL